MFVLEVTKALSDANVPYAIVGGYALALQGIVRATMDVDLVIRLTPKALSNAESALYSIGLQSRIPVTSKEIAEFRQEYIEKRNLIAWSFVDHKNPTRQVDILLTENLSNLKRKSISLGGHKVIVADLSEILKMKLKSNRPQDLVDIESIKRVLKNGKI